MPSEVHTDVVIVGAGPCGLFQAFELGLLGVSCRIVEALPHPGGQCAELYPDKPIYDIPGVPHTRADQLTRQLIEQLQPFEQTFHYDTSVSSIDFDRDHFRLTTSNDTFVARCVVLAVGVGAFSPVKLKTDGIDRLENRAVFYSSIDSAHASGRNVIVCGDGEQAVTEALTLSERASVTLLHRTRRLSIDDATKHRLDESIERGALSAVKGKIAGFATADGGELERVQIQLSRSETTEQPADIILVRQGTSPKLVPFEQFGLTDAGSRISVDPASFETAVAGLYAVGDVNLYPAKRKLILCGFHEATLAAFAIAERLRPGKPVHLQYTTTSTELRQRLGVA